MSSPAHIAVIAALPREIHGLLGRMRAEPLPAQADICVYNLGSAVVTAAGMGADRVTLAVEAALRIAPEATLISAGLAGSCSPDLAPGSVAEATTVIDSLTGERFRTAAPSSATHTLVTTPSIASVAEKARLAQTYGAAMVDMEAATVARLASARGVPFRAIKGISDAHNFELASLGRFTGPHGQFRTKAFALHTALHPGEWRSALTLGRNSQQALAELTNQLRAIVSA